MTYNFYDTDSTLQYIQFNPGMTLTITQGGEYGTLWNMATDETGNTITTPPDYYSTIYDFWNFPIFFLANGNVPCANQTVTIKVDPNNPTIAPAFLNIIVLPPTCLSMHVATDTIGTSGTIDVSILQQTSCGIYGPAQGTFNVSIDNKSDGKLFSPQTNQRGSSLTNVPPTFKFIAANTISTDTTQVVITAEQYNPNGGMPGSINVPIEKSQNTIIPRISNSTLILMDKVSKQLEKVNRQLSTIKDTDKNKVRLNAAKAGLEKVLALGYTGGQTCQIDPQATVVIEAPKSNFPQCSSYTNPYVQLHITTNNCHADWDTWIPLPSVDFLNIQICCNRNSNCYSLMIPAIQGEIQIDEMIATSPGGENIDSENGITSNEERDAVVRAFQNQIKEYTAVRNAIATGQPYSKPRSDDYQCNAAFLVHEMVHYNQCKALIISLIEKYKKSVSNCVTYQAPDDAIQELFQNEIDNVRLSFWNELQDDFKKSKVSWEPDAYDAQLKFLNDLVYRIQNKNYSN